MGVMFEYTGVVKEKKEVEKFESGFQKQELIVTDDIDQHPMFPNILCFSFKKDRVEKLVPVKEGQRVKITFAIDGRAWTYSSGVVKYYTDLTALKLDILAGGTEAPQKPLGTIETAPEEIKKEDDPPF